MQLSSLEMVSDSCIKVHGEMTFATILSLLKQSKPLLDSYQWLTFDLSAVTQTDSAGLALLIEWLRIAQHNKQRVQFTHLPKQLIQIAKVCDLETILMTISDKK